MPTETERRVDAVLGVLDYLRDAGDIPTDLPVSPAGMAYVAKVIGQPVSKSTFVRLQRRGLARLKQSEKARLALDTLLHLRSQQS